MQLSTLGLGTYLGQPTEAADIDYAEAARAFFTAGGTVFDTAANYRNGHSERALGTAFKNLPRGEFFVSTKAGYIPMPEGDPEEGPRAWFHRVLEGPGILSVDDLVDGCHALTPKYLAHQLDVSREALGLETLDLFHLHNPEQQLPHLGPEAFYAMIGRAFEACEGFVGSRENPRLRRGHLEWVPRSARPGGPSQPCPAAGGRHRRGGPRSSLPLDPAAPQPGHAGSLPCADPGTARHGHDPPGRRPGQRALRADLGIHHAGTHPPPVAGWALRRRSASRRPPRRPSSSPVPAPASPRPSAAWGGPHM